MTQSSKKNRIIFIDLMRAFAVLMMVQGHTVDALLSDDFRNMSSPLFSIWLFMRGMTAPIFMFTAGTVFTYLFRLANEPFATNPRVKKGIKRFLLLVGLGYLLRYPTPLLIDFTYVTEQSWDVFFAVDVLQLIGFGILFLIICAYLAEKFKLPDYIVFALIGLSFFLLYTLFAAINWVNFLPAPIAGYFYTGTGSLFPLFPWAGYVVCGGVLGSYLARNPLVFKTIRFSKLLAFSGAILILFFFAINLIEKIFYGDPDLYHSKLGIICLRIGFVLILNAIVSFISIEVSSIPRLIILIGRNTLLIYVVHLVILYGSAWNPGLVQPFGRSFNVFNTLTTVLIMFSLMVSMVVVVNKLKIKSKELVT
jgi:uncharacterized membrane protein